MFFSSIKETNRLIRKGMSNIYYWDLHLLLTDVLKTSISSERKSEEMQ